MAPDPLTVTIDAAVRDRFPETDVIGLIVDDLPPASSALAAEIARIWAAASARLAAEGITLDTIASAPAVAAWRSAIGACGVKAANYRSSAEAVARRLLKSGPFATGLPIVDLYCAVSALHLAPLGGYDIDRLPPDEITIRFARPETDRFTPLGGRAEDMPMLASVVVYAAGDEVLCWAWNHRDSALTGLTLESRRCLFVAESVDPGSHARAREALSELERVFANLGCRTSRMAA